MQVVRFFRHLVVASVCFVAHMTNAEPLDLGFSPFSLAVAAVAADDTEIADFYRKTNYQPIWTGEGEIFQTRRRALLEALDMARVHGLPTDRYNETDIIELLKTVKTARDLGRAEVLLTQTLVRFSEDLSFGVTDPARVNPSNKRRPHMLSAGSYLQAFVQSRPRSYFKSLPPSTNEYARLLKEKYRLENIMMTGGWGPAVRVGGVEYGQSGPSVVALRDRLVAMGYLETTASQSYDYAMKNAVRAFQTDHGLTADGVAGPGTMREINTPVEERLKSVIVAMERERWMNTEREPYHVLVNLTDFTARIIENDVLKFETRSVIGKNKDGQQTPEFSDEIEYMVINPTWNVPRSIVVKEYLPRMKRNRNAAGHLDIYNSRGRKVSRGAINFAKYNARNFPYAMKQKPSARNALGLVKFMFPNPYNIYLHDTPSKGLFHKEVRAYSHGCIRLQKPFEFAYTLLSAQEENPKSVFHKYLATGRESVVRLKKPVPVHLIYRTAFTSARGGMEYRRDIYGRDARIWTALTKAGVKLPAIGG